MLDSYESAGIDNDVSEPLGYEQQLAARRMAEEAMEADDGRRRGRKRGLPGALEGELFIACGCVCGGVLVLVLVGGMCKLGREGTRCVVRAGCGCQRGIGGQQACGCGVKAAAVC